MSISLFGLGKNWCQQRIHRNLFSTISKLKIPKLIKFTNQGLNRKFAFFYLRALAQSQGNGGRRTGGSASGSGMAEQGRGATEVVGWCRRFETGGSLSRRVNVAACPSPDGSSARASAKGGK
jgi:hypothetical protein